MDRIDPAQLSPEELFALARWFADMGVDCAVSEDSQDRFAAFAAEADRAQASAAQPFPDRPSPAGAPALAGKSPAPAGKPSASAGRPGNAPAPPPPETAQQSAREAAAAATTLEELQAALEAFEGCGLKRTASRLVFADGAPGARIMLVGEAPGADEDRQGKPFVGRAGHLLDRMLAAIGLDRTGVYIANVVPWRPPGNRTPTPQEAQVCLPFIRRQIELANPAVLACLGGSAAQALLGVKDGILRTRGKWFDLQLDNGASIPAIAMLHPAFLLRTPIRKREAWRDMLAMKKRLEKPEAGAAG